MDKSDTGAAARSLRQWPLLIVVAGLLCGLVIAVIGANTWRLGALVIGCSLAVGAVERIALPRREAGLLQVRGRAFDIAVLAMTGGAIIALAILVPGRR
jgi:hypothetical protein